MEKIEIWLRNDKLKFYTRISWIIIFLNVVAFLLLAFFSTVNDYRSSSIAGLILISIVIILKFYKPKWQIDFWYFSIIIIGTWGSMKQYWIGGSLLFIEVLRSTAMMRKVVAFYHNNVIYPSWPVKNIRWSELNNVILKDGLLTIDQKNNKLIQQEIDKTRTSINEKDFNDFCIQKLYAGHLT
jgi:hypothetical protein